MKSEIKGKQKEFCNKGFRRVMTCAYIPDGTVFNGQPNILPDSYLQQIHVDDPLNYDAQNPLIYKN